MIYNIINLVRNTADQYSATVSATFDNLKSAKVNYHQTCAALNNASDVKIAVVKIEDEFGNPLTDYSEKIENVTETEEAETE
jgi:hypothetical protein